MFRKLAAVACVATASLGLAPALAEASPPVPGTGSYAVTGFVENASKPIGSYTYANQTISLANFGVLDGPSTTEANCLLGPTGDGFCVGTEHFDGTIGGRTGSADFVVAISVVAGQFDGTFAAASAHATVVTRTARPPALED